MMRYGVLTRPTSGYDAGHFVTYLYTASSSRLQIQPLAEKRLASSKLGSFLPTFYWDAKKYIVPTDFVKAVAVEALGVHIRQRLGRPYLVSMGKTSYIYLYKGIREITDGHALHYDTLMLSTDTYEWLSNARDVISTMQFFDRPLTDEETSLVAIANLQMTDDV
jgi:hypothetical protein